MEYFELIARRESCRNYDPARPVEREKLVACVEAARIAPSACNSQPWSFVAVTEPGLAASLASCCQQGGMNKFASQAPAFVVAVGEKGNKTSRFGAAVKDQDFASVDMGIAAAHFCLAATAQGLSTCMMGWFDEKKVKSLLSIPEEKRVRLVIALGYAADDSLRPKKRKSLEEILRFAGE